MIVTGNPLLTGASGKIKNLVVKQYKDKTVITAVPDMSGRKLSPKQKKVNERMQMANIAARHVMADPRLKQRACEMLQVEPNKVFRAIVKQFLLTDGYGGIFEETAQEKLDKQTLATLVTTITTEVPDAELMLFGDRTKGTYNAKKRLGNIDSHHYRSSPGAQMGVTGKIVPHYHSTRHTRQYFAGPKSQLVHHAGI